MKRRKIIALTIAVLMVLTAVFTLGACGNKSSDSGTTTPSDNASGSAASNVDVKTLTLTPGKLTIATGNPAWAPWVLNDDPASGEGFEAAVAYAVADKLGFAKEDVVWVRSDFDAAIQPGPKDFDFNLQQYSITADRLKIVDFSSPYYKESLVVITKANSKYANAKTIADLKDAVFGAAQGDIAVQFTADKMGKDPQIFNNLSDVFLALESGQIDATITGLLTAEYVVNIEKKQITDGVIVGSIPGSDAETGGLGLLLSKDNPLTPYVSKAVDELWADGTIDKLASQWLGDYSVPVLN